MTTKTNTQNSHTTSTQHTNQRAVQHPDQQTLHHPDQHTIQHPKMALSQRAKQFAPFAALTGLDAALRRKEEEHRHQLESEIQAIIDPETYEL